MSYYKRKKEGKKVIEKLKSGKHDFRIAGFEEIYTIHVSEMSSGNHIYSVSSVTGWGSMNIGEFGATQMKLYDYDLFGNGTNQVIKYEDITFE